MILDNRKERILQAIVDYYVNRAEPIASKIIADVYGLDLSSATIRNEMAEMEGMGLIEKPHTSAGRIPSDLGYRYYVDSLMEEHVSEEEQENVKRLLEESQKDILQKISMALSGATHYTTIAFDDDGIVLYGRNNVFDFPEFNDVDSLRKFMYLLEEEEMIKDFFQKIHNSDITVTIGKENQFEQMRDYSLVTFSYHDLGDIAIIGPKRMDYSKVIGYIKYLLEQERGG
ncbi:MAG: hypothetical protein J6M02_01025 [Clostridia bacterium]|nr:hypothetical protein [Clostridia bacterium]